MHLLGRRAERDQLLAAANTTAAGATVVALLRGEPGIGKTTLLRFLRDHASTAGWRVLDGSVTAAERDLGWASLAGVIRTTPSNAFDHLSATQRGALVAVAGGEPVEHVNALTVAAGFADLVIGLARKGPTLLVLDDLQWLDESSAAAYSFLLRTCTDVPLLVAAASRPAATPLDLGRVANTSRLTVIELGGLSLSASRKLLHDELQLELSRVDLLRIHEVTGGNPLHTLEGGMRVRAGLSIHDALAPATIDDLLVATVADLPPASREVLAAAALLAHPDITTLTAMFSEPAVVAGLSDGERTSLIRIEGDSVHLRHPLVAGALLADVSTLERRALHRKCAAAVGDPVARAVHLASAHHQPDADAAQALEQAALSADARGLPAQATQFARRSVELTPPADAAAQTRRRLLIAESAWGAGANEEARANAREVLDRLDGAERRRAMRIIGLSTVMLDGVVTGLPTVREWVESCEAGSPERVDALIGCSRILLFAADMSGAAAAALEAAEIAQAIADEQRHARALAARAIAQMMASEPVDLDPLVAAAGRGQDHGAPSLRGMVCELCVWSDRLGDARRLLADELDDARRLGEVITEMNAHNQLATAHERSGDLAAAEHHIEAARTIAESVGNRGAAGLRALELAMLLELRGRPDLADERLADAPPLASYSGLDTVDARARLGRLAALRGHWPQAADHLTAAHRDATAAGLLEPGCLGYHADLVEALLQVQRADEAATVAADLRAAADRSGRPRASAEALRAEGLVAAARNRNDEAIALLAEAADTFAALAVPLDEARTRLHLGRLARRLNQRARAKEQLTAAGDLFARAGATGLASRAEADLLRAAGGASASELTPTETQIAALVAEGRTNDEVAATLFVSRRTVEANLTRIYRKLGVSSRTALAVRLRSLSAAEG